MATSVAVVTQAPEHALWPVGHDVAQRPETQRSPAPQLTSQAPQWAGSLSSVAHTPPHSLWPVGHEVTQRPAAHDCPAAQVVPQVPQLRRSVCVSTQSREAPVTHSVRVPEQPERQVPSEQT